MCSSRLIAVGKKGKKRKVRQCFHRGVVAHLIGFDMPVVLDFEMSLPGEGEIVTARRLLLRILSRYARFFDVVQGDALYFEAPLFHLCQGKGKYLLAVLKENNPALLTEAKALLQGEPDLEYTDDKKHIKCWDQEGFTTDAIRTPFRVLRTEEKTNCTERIARKKVESEKESTWFWATTIPQNLISSRQLGEIGHARWKIENRIFNALPKHWGLDHCFHHHPTAINNFILTLFIAHTLLFCFRLRNIKIKAVLKGSLKDLASEILSGISFLKNGDAAWLQSPKHSPPR